MTKLFPAAICLVLAAAGASWTACRIASSEEARLPSTGGNPAEGVLLIRQFGCGSCHIVPGIRQARGLVGPPLICFGRRTYIAGQLPNVPENLVRWIQAPPSVERGTAMPVLGLTEKQARDVAAYLYTLTSADCAGAGG